MESNQSALKERLKKLYELAKYPDASIEYLSQNFTPDEIDQIYNLLVEMVAERQS